ncbi:MAG: hypothetical protein IKO36_00925 [Bacteroidaceae bacterium]|nr:hypothetical protein [Bacteroidaceae bacterium]
MNFQEVLNTVQSNEGKTVLCHCTNWVDSIWVAFKRNECGVPVCTIFLCNENGSFSFVNGARFAQIEVADIVADWEVKVL